jgi:hypothetical protein
LNGYDLIFADQRDAEVGLDPEHILFVANYGSDDLLSVLKNDLFRAGEGGCAQKDANGQ